METSFFMPTQVRMGRNVVQESGALLAGLGKRAMLVTGRSSAVKCGAQADVTAALEKNGQTWVVFDQVMSNPTVDCVYAGADLARREGVDFLIAIGGGSPMDAAKAIALLARQDLAAEDLFQGGFTGDVLPMVHIPTTAGTGSEVTLATVITDSDHGYTFPINDLPLIPKVAVLDVENTRTMPPSMTATTGMDALTHAVEAFIGRSTTAATRSDALEATRLIFANLETAYRDGDNLEARERLSTAAFLAGRAFSKSYVGYVHAVAHSLGGRYNVPHGLANAVLLPIVLEAYGPCIHKKLHQLAVAAGISREADDPTESAKRFIGTIREMNRRMDIPETLSEVQEADIPLLAEHAAREANPLYPVPVLMDAKTLEQFYYQVADRRNAWTRKTLTGSLQTSAGIS